MLLPDCSCIFATWSQETDPPDRLENSEAFSKCCTVCPLDPNIADTSRSGQRTYGSTRRRKHDK